LNIGKATAKTPARFAVVVAKKSIPLAVNRNRAKRLAREVFRADAHLVPVGWEVVLIARSSMLKKPLVQLKRLYATAIAGVLAKHEG
jgi:ribonuclease P protein component